MSSINVSTAFRSNAPRRSESSNATSSRLPYSPPSNDSDALYHSTHRVKRPSTGHQSAPSVRSVKQVLKPFAEEPKFPPTIDGEASSIYKPRLEPKLPPSPPLTRVGTGDSIRADDRGAKRLRAADAIEDENDRTRVGEEVSDEVDMGTWSSRRRDELVDGERTFNQNDTLEDADLSEMSFTKSAPQNPSVSLPSPAWASDHPLRGTASTDALGKNDMKMTNGDITGHGEKHSPTTPKETPVRKKQPIKSKPPHSSYYFGPVEDSAFGTEPIGQIGVHHPREIIRIERDYSAGDLPQFSASYPLELEGRLSPSQFMESMTAINDILESAYSLSWACLDNTIAILTFYLSRLIFSSHYDRQIRKMRQLVDNLNMEVYNPMGLNIIWPRDVAFLFLEIEYY